jgi:hypothetical protein
MKKPQCGEIPSPFRGVFVYALFTAFSLAVLGQADAARKDDPELARAQQKKWNEFYRTTAATYAITLDGDRERKLKFHPEPVLLWSNPVRYGETNGSVFVWTYEGRVEAVGTIFSHLAREDETKRYIAHSFHSLSLEPLVADRNEADAWSIKVPGIEPKKIPDAPVPADTAPLRLTQMRDLAREFSATTSLDGVDHDLRLLTQPLYRYESKSPDVIDGALFTFVTGTDPELMLVIEARRTAGAVAWHFGAGRFTDLSLTLRHNQTVLWNSDRGLTEDGTRSPYISRRIELRDRMLP